MTLELETQTLTKHEGDITKIIHGINSIYTIVMRERKKERKKTHKSGLKHMQTP